MTAAEIALALKIIAALLQVMDTQAVRLVWNHETQAAYETGRRYVQRYSDG